MKRLVLAALTVVCSGCHSVVSGTAAPADHLGPLPGVIAPPVKVPPLRDKLLTGEELAAIVGETSLTLGDTYLEPADDWKAVDPPGCASRILAAQQDAYMLWRTMYGTGYRGAAGRTVTEIVASFPHDYNATYKVSQWVLTWKKCSDTVTVHNGDDVSRWTPGPITSDDTTRASTSQARQDSARVCSHVLGVSGVHTVEATVCGEDGQTDRQAGEVTDRILAKISR